MTQTEHPLKCQVVLFGAPPYSGAARKDALNGAVVKVPEHPKFEVFQDAEVVEMLSGFLQQGVNVSGL